MIAISVHLRNGRDLLSDKLHNRTTGAKTTAPAKSPSHHVSQTGAAWASSAFPASIKLLTPSVALIVVVAAQISANLPTPAGDSKTCLPSAHQVTKYAVASASSVLPKAMEVDVRADPAVR